MKIVQIPGIGLSSNIYVIIDEKTAVIDAGIHEISQDTVEAIEEIAPRPDYLILTHRHVDHIGGSRALKDAFGMRVFAGEKDAKAIESADPLSTGAEDFGLSLFPVDVQPLKDGDVINLGEMQLTVLETPGHTIGSISLYGNNGELFSGDTVFADGGIGRWDLPTGDYSMLRESVERLADIEVISLHPGHGRYILKDGKRHIEMAMRAVRYY